MSRRTDDIDAAVEIQDHVGGVHALDRDLDRVDAADRRGHVIDIAGDRDTRHEVVERGSQRGDVGSEDRAPLVATWRPSRVAVACSLIFPCPRSVSCSSSRRSQWSHASRHRTACCSSDHNGRAPFGRGGESRGRRRRSDLPDRRRDTDHLARGDVDVGHVTPSASLRCDRHVPCPWLSLRTNRDCPVRAVPQGFTRVRHEAPGGLAAAVDACPAVSLGYAETLSRILEAQRSKGHDMNMRLPGFDGQVRS